MNGNNFANRIRLSLPQKSIWIYTGYTWEEIWENTKEYHECNLSSKDKQRYILSLCDVLIDGRYIDSKRDIILPYRGSSNQRLIDIQKSLQKGEVVLWQT